MLLIMRSCKKKQNEKTKKQNRNKQGEAEGKVCLSDAMAASGVWQPGAQGEEKRAGSYYV